MTAKLKIIEETLGDKFNYDNYLNFIVNFLKQPRLFNKKRDERIWKEYLSSIEAYYKIGDYKDDNGSEILILAVELKRGSTVERARSLQRNFISKILDGSSYEAAIVAFYTENEDNWRLSFVKLDYKLTEEGLELDLTPARRFSYLVGKNEPTHTAKKRLLRLIEEDSKNPSLDDIEDAFSIEKVTDDFFKHYKEKYLQLKEYLETSADFIEETEKLGLEVEFFSEQFSKKLMGQIAFLYFLQKKGWLGVRLLPKDRIITLKDYTDLSQNLKDKELKILNKTFILDVNQNIYYMDMEEYKMLSDKEIDDLSNIFKNTKFDMAWGTGEKQFIRGLFDFCEENTTLNFFDEYLEPFFYEALNKERKNSYYRRFNCKIPFLNGGLFEPLEGYHWEDVNFKIPNEIFSNKNQKGEYADGILDIFDRYNFTINEAEPLEKEVAVDPEMLGKVFENLLDVNSRKSKGAFYTPREIVHFMCQETLANYISSEVNIPYEDVKKFILYGELIRDQDNTKEAEGTGEYIIPESIYNNIVEIDKALDNVRVADPAVGSGAFPLGMLTEIVNAKDNITEYIIKKDRERSFEKRIGENAIRNWRSSYKIKWKTIRDCIYAVDIDASAVDITKLRLWLSLVVDQELEENENPHPLPNLDMNIHVGNSLIDQYEGIELFDKSILSKKDKLKKTDEREQLRIFFDSDEILEDIFKKQLEYFEEFDDVRKKSLKLGIDNLREQLIMKRLREEGNIEALDKYKKIKDNRSQPFFIWELEFAKVFKEKGGFDIVIGNPPYIQLQANNGYLANQFINLNYKTFRRSGDIYTLFYEKGIQLLKKEGYLMYITSNKWMRTNYGKPLRKYLLNYNPKVIIDLGQDVFENAKVDTNILLVEKNDNKNELYGVSLSNNRKKQDFTILINSDIAYISDLTEENWVIGSRRENEFRIKIEKNNIYLKDLNIKISYGIKTGKNDVFIIDNGLKEILEKQDNNNSNIIKPVLKGRNIRKHKVNWNNEWIIVTGYDKDIPKDYPEIYNYLQEFESDLKKRYDRGKNWYNLRKCSYYDEMESKKIIYSEIVQGPQFYLDLKGEFYVEASAFIMTGDNIEYIYGILNSKAFTYFFKKWYSGGGLGNKGYRYKKAYLENTPIPNITSENIDIVEELKKVTVSIYKEERINMQETQEIIDSLVYKLYNLSEEEIGIIEKYFYDENDN